MMNSFFGYILLALSLSAPIGPVNAAQLDKGIRYGFWNAWLLGLGAMAADAAFMLLIYFGSAHVLQTPFIRSFLWTFGCFVLLYTGIESFKKAQTIQKTAAAGREPPSKSFVQGFLLTLGNPLSILFWLGIYGSILAETALHADPIIVLRNTCGIFLGILLWDFAMAGAASTFTRLASDAILTFLSRAAGVVLIAFGAYFGVQSFKLLFSTP